MCCFQITVLAKGTEQLPVDAVVTITLNHTKSLDSLSIVYK